MEQNEQERGDLREEAEQPLSEEEAQSTAASDNEQETILASHLGSGALHHFRALGLIAGERRMENGATARKRLLNYGVFVGSNTI